MVSQAVMSCCLAFSLGAPAPPPIDINRLIAQLAAGKLPDREAAARMLQAIGEPALDKLYEAATSNPDPEIRKRSSAIHEAINRMLFNEVKSFPMHRPWTTRLIVGRDGKQVLSNGQDGPRIWTLANPETSRPLDPLANGARASSNALALSANGRRAAGASAQNVVVWDVESGKVLQTLAGHTKTVSCVAISGDGAWVASGSYDGSVRFWDAVNGKELVAFNDLGLVRCMELSPDGTLLAASVGTKAADPGVIHIWDTKARKLTQTLHGHEQMVGDLAFSPDGKLLASASWDRTIRIWPLQGGRKFEPLTGHNSRVVAVAFSADGSRLVSCGDDVDKSLHVWQTDTGKRRFSGTMSIGMNALAALPDGKSMLVGCKDGSVRIWRWTK